MEAIVLVVLLLLAGTVVLAFVGLVAIVRWLVSGPRPTHGAPCPYCGRWTAGARARCDWCGHALAGRGAAATTDVADLAAMERQLWRMKSAGVFTSEEMEMLLGRVTQYRARLMGPAPAKAGRPPAPRREAEEVRVEVVQEPAAPRAQAQTPPRRPAPPVAPPRPVLDGAKPQAAPQIHAPKPQAAPVIHAPKPPAAPIKPVPPPKPAEPRKPWTEMLGAFMEDRNIRIGELVGGLLFVVFSVLLTVNLWHYIQEVPLSQFFISVAVSSAVFGAGFYAQHRMRLQATGMTLLTIATLLVPLNFLTIAAGILQADLSPLWLVIALLAQAAALGVFAWLSHHAARVLVPAGPWHQVAAVLGGSAAVLAVGRLIGPGSPAWQVSAAGGVPALCFAGCVGAYLWRTKKARLDVVGAGAAFTLLGTAAFAMLVPWGLLLHKATGADAAGLPAVLGRLAVWLTVAAGAVLAAGLAVMRGTTRDKSLAPYRTAGTGVALGGAVLMLAALGMAWPMPPEMTAVSLLSAAALLVAAFRYRMPLLHAGVIAFAATAYLTGYHFIRNYGRILELSREEMARDLLQRLLNALAGTGSALSGTALVGLCAVLGAAGELLARRGWRHHGLVYARGAAVVAVLSLSLVTLPGLLRGEDTVRAMIVYGIYGAGGLALNLRWRSAAVSYVGLALLVGATCFGLRTAAGPEVFWAAVLAQEALVMALAAAALGYFNKRDPSAGRGLADVYRLPLWHVAEAVAALAVALGVWTAWHQRALVAASPTPVLAVAAACCAATWLLLAWTHRTPERTWAASMVALAGLVHTLACNYTGLVALPWPAALLGHATLAVAGAAALDYWARRRRLAGGSAGALAGAVRRVMSDPLEQTAILSSVLALGALAFSWQASLDWTALALGLAWLAGVWLALAVCRGSAGLVSAHQAASAAAVVAGVLAWLEGQTWAVPLSVNPLHPWTLQACGAGLAAFSLAWLGVRIALERDRAARGLLDPPWPAVDWLLLHGLAAAQLAMLTLPLLEGVSLEMLRPTTLRPVAAAAFGPGAWLLLGLLGAAIVVSLWRRWDKAELVSALLLLATVPCLAAGRMADDLAAASILRWGLGLVFLLASAAVWLRGWLGAGARAARTRTALPPVAPRLARGTLVAVAAAPVVLLTLAAALLQLAGSAAAWPHAMHPAVSYLVPLVLVIGGMVGYAARDRSAGYAFSAGLVADLAVVLGYALAVVMAGGAIGTRETAVVIQLGTIAASVWAILWLAARRWVTEEGDASDMPRSSKLEASPSAALMSVQLAMPLAGNAALLGGALFVLTLVPVWMQKPYEWTVAAGGPLGWIALVLPVAAAVYRRVQAGRRVRPQTAGLMGVAAVGLLACTVQGVLPDEPWGYRTLMLGWAAYALFVAAAAWWVATVRTLPGAEGPPQALLRAASFWVALAGGLAVALGLKAAVLHRPAEDLLWAAAAVAVAAGAGATMAYWRRAEGWAFISALGVNTAASLAVWYFQRQVPFLDWWVLLAQANVIATAAVALVWLAARRRLYQFREFSVRTSPLLGTQTALAVAGLAFLLALPAAHLLGAPRWLPSWAGRMADPAGWIALVLVAAASVGYLHQIARRHLFHAAGGLALALPVMLACLTAEGRLPYDPGDWFSYHVLLTALAAAGLVLLGGAMLAARAGQAFHPAGAHVGQAFQPDGAPREPRPGAVRLESLTYGWSAWLGAAAVALAVLWSQSDPEGLWLRVRAVLAVAVTAGILAMWLRAPACVVVSGLLLCAAGTLIWSIEGPATLLGLAQTNIVCLALGAVIWTALKPAHRDGVPPFDVDGRALAFSHAAAVAALIAMAAVAAVLVAGDLAGQRAAPLDGLAWTALAAVGTALAVCLWDGAARFPLPGLYVLGLAAIGLAWHARGFTPREVVWTAATELTGFALGAAALGWLVRRAGPAWRFLRIPSPPGRFTGQWFDAAQAAVAVPGAVLCAWVALDFGFDGLMDDTALLGLSGRLASMAGALFLLGTAVVMAEKGDRSNSPRSGPEGASHKLDLSPFSPEAERWRVAGFGAGLLLQCAIGWALLDPAAEAPWLHRSVTLLVGAVLTMLLSSAGLARILPSARHWIESGRRAAPWFGFLAAAALAAVLVQEGVLYDRDVGPLALWEVLVVAGALAGLAAASIAMAVSPGLDRFGLTERGRAAYVYAAEALVLLLCVHVRLTLPELFGSGFFLRHWMLILMGAAFAGAGLSEFFHRRGLPVLSGPLERTAFVLPLAIAVGFWFQPEALSGLPGLAGPSPAVWLLIGAFYAVCAWLGRPAGAALPSALAVAAVNMGLWVFWHRMEIDFLHNAQLWLIPVGVCVLVAEYLNHGRLTAAQSGTVRYLALGLIYVSSTADMYTQGIGQSVVLPLVLMLLSVAGVLLGILLRVRSFLVLGITFLMVLAVTMVNHAAFTLNQIWVLYACGVATALAIIVLFAVFEKRRNDILRAAEKFRHWER